MREHALSVWSVTTGSYWNPTVKVKTSSQVKLKQEWYAVWPCTQEGSDTSDLHSKELIPQAQEVGPWKESSCTKHQHPCLANPTTQHQQPLINVGDVRMAGTTPRGLPDRVELLMVLAGVVTSGSSWAHSAGGRTGFSGSSWRSPEQGAASPCSTSAEIASLGSRPELSLCLLLSVSEELDVDNCCLN